jgi:hypothetical protein
MVIVLGLVKGQHRHITIAHQFDPQNLQAVIDVRPYLPIGLVLKTRAGVDIVIKIGVLAEESQTVELMRHFQLSGISSTLFRGYLKRVRRTFAKDIQVVLRDGEDPRAGQAIPGLFQFGSWCSSIDGRLFESCVEDDCLVFYSI